MEGEAEIGFLGLVVSKFTRTPSFESIIERPTQFTRNVPLGLSGACLDDAHRHRHRRLPGTFGGAIEIGGKAV